MQQFKTKELMVLPTPPPTPSPPRPYVVEDWEAANYFYGSRSLLVARSDSSTRLWETIVGKGPWPQYRFLENVGDHKALASFWLNPSKREKFVELLESMSVEFTTIDPVRIVEPEPLDYACDRLTVGHRALAIAIKPHTLSREKGVDVVVACKALLCTHDVFDVECLIREAECFSSAGPVKFEEPARPINHVDTGYIRIPTTSTLGTSISTTTTPEIDGTRGFYVASEDSGKLYFLTCRHVVLPCESAAGVGNAEYNHSNSNEPQIPVTQPSNAFLTSARERGKQEIEDLGNRKGSFGVRYAAGYAIRRIEGELAILNRWEESSNRVIGHVAYSPPLSVAHDSGYTLDVAVCEIYPTLLDAENFFGNAVDWGSSLDVRLRRYNFGVDQQRLKRLHGLIPIDELMNPKKDPKTSQGSTEDSNGVNIESLMVCKRGAASAVTFGRANNLPSLRTYFFTDTDKKFRALEWGIFPCDRKRGTEAFSKCGGDSGATVFDHQGRILGLLNGWSGSKNYVNITYVTPAEFVVNEIGKRWEKVHTNVVGRDVENWGWD